VAAALAAPEAALAQFRAELNERLVVHWTGGAWRVPLGTRHLAVQAMDGSALGRIVCAEADDAARARAGLIPAPLTAQAAARALDPVAPLLARLRALEGAAGDGCVPGAPGLPPPGQGPLVLYTAHDLPLADLVALLVAGSGRGVIWKPAPRAAASAHLVMRALAPVAGRALAMVQGDHASGAALAGLGAPAWAGQGPPPPGLG
jgi:hypothetical protein